MVQSQPAASGLIVLFGATGDLAARKLYPAIYQLYKRQRLDQHFAVIGTARRQWDTEYFRQMVAESIHNFVPNYDPAVLRDMLKHFFYVANDATKTVHFSILKEKMLELKTIFNLQDDYLYYFSIAPHLFSFATENLKKTGITGLPGTHRVLVEKPFGHDRSSAIALNRDLNIAFDSDKIYRIDHYVGKETVQNIWCLRQYNPIVEAIWNRNFIDNVQITLSEDLPVGSRGGYYDSNGALLDMFQNHILQVMAFVGMNLPTDTSSEALHREKAAFLKSIDSLSTEQVAAQLVRGQYGASGNGHMVAYRDEKNISKQSHTETFVAGKLFSNYDRWRDVPFYFRTGKQLANGKYTTVEIIFKSQYSSSEHPSRLTFVITPELGVRFTLNEKYFGNIDDVKAMDLYPEQQSLSHMYFADSYEGIIYRALRGDKTVFTTMDELNEQWRITDSIRNAWTEMPDPEFPNYPALSYGPEDALKLIDSDQRCWIDEPQWRSKKR